MANIEISRDREAIRLFRSDFLEFFTHIHPAAVLVLWTPVAIYFLVSAVVWRPAVVSWLYVPLGFLLGMVLWTLAEYVLHRFVFHFHPRARWQERLAFLFHGVHHAQPMVKTRLVMPPPVSIPLALAFYGLFYLILGLALGVAHWVAPLFAGFVVGYLLYDMLHYSTHHFRFGWRYWRFVRRHHMHHHVRTPDKRFGVTSPLWDFVFGTMPRDGNP